MLVLEVYTRICKNFPICDGLCIGLVLTLTNDDIGCESDYLGMIFSFSEIGCWYYGRVYRVGEKVGLGDRCLNRSVKVNQC